MRFVDTHCHINDREAFPDPNRTLHEAQGHGVDRCIVIGIDEGLSERAVQLAERYPGVWAVVGWHPNHAHEWTAEGWARIEAWATHPRVVGIGETGRDNHWDYAPAAQQWEVWERHVDLAQRVEKPIIIHCREAYPELLDWLEANPVSVPLLFHCWAGNAEDAERAIRLGAWFGVDGPVTYKKADELRAVVAMLPRDRVLLETDAPYLTPHPHRGERNRPAYIPLIAEGLARVWGCSVGEVASITTTNAKRLFPAIVGSA